MPRPFIDHVGMTIDEHAGGRSRCSLVVGPEHFNSSGTVHGAVLFTLADTGMGAALYSTLAAGESGATIEIKINYFRPVTGGTIVCDGAVVYRGRSVANLEAKLFVDDKLVALANGSFAVLRRDAAA